MWLERNRVLEYFEKFYGNGSCSIEGIRQSCENLQVYLTPNQIENWLNAEALKYGINLNSSTLTTNKNDNQRIIKTLIENNKLDKSMIDKYIFNPIDYKFYQDELNKYIFRCEDCCYLIRLLADTLEEHEKRIDFNPITIGIDVATYTALPLYDTTSTTHQIIDTYEGKIWFYDLTIRDNYVLKEDVDRIAKPLMENYRLAILTFLKANDYKTYLETKCDPMFIEYDDFEYKKILDNLCLRENLPLEKKHKHPEQHIELTAKQREQFKDLPF